MRRGLLLALAVFLAISFSVSAASRKKPHKGTAIMPLSEIKPGMTGYGKSIFKGTKIEKFNVEVIDVLKNTHPGQDLILVKVSGQNLEFSGVIAGMSGSPIYIDDKLVGALAYAWSFAKEPFAGVTPIEYMLAELDRPLLPANRKRLAAPMDGSVPELAANHEMDFGGRMMKRIATPLIMSGFSQAAIAELANDFKPYNIVPMIGGDSSKDGDEKIPVIEPGSAIGIQLVKGDISMTAVGTLTYRNGDDVLGFGHPFMGGGQMSMSLVAAKIHSILPSQNISFKFASPIGEIGSLVQDRLSCISGKLGAKPLDMVPVSVDVINANTGRKASYYVEVAQHTSLTPKLISASIQSLLSVAETTVAENTVDLKMTIKIKGHREVVLKNTFFNPVGPFNKGMVVPLGRLIFNPFEVVEMESVKVEATIRHDITLARITSIYFDKNAVKAGGTAKLHVVIKPFNAESVEEVFEINVPENFRGRKILISVGGGNSIPPDVALPVDFDGILDLFEARHKSSDLVLVQPLPTVGIKASGRKLPNLPGSAIRLLRPGNVTGGRVTKDLLFKTRPTKWIIMGRQQGFLWVKQ